MALCASLGITLFGTRAVHAQDEADIMLSARVGFDGHCMQGAWLPIHVEIQNSGQDLDGVIEASYDRGAGGRSITRMEIDLPATSRKEVFLYIYYAEGFSPKFTISLLDGRQVLKQVSYRMNCLGRDSMIFGVLADNVSAYDVLNDVKPLRGPVRVAQLTVADLPDQAQAWNTLHALVISKVDTGLLTASQKQALNSWLAAGGRLFIVGGFDWQGTAAGLKDFMPLQIDSTRRVGSLSELQTYVHSQDKLDSEAVLSTGRVHQDAHVLLEQDGVPLLVQRSFGFGVVYFFAADPALRPLSGWAGMKDVYEHLLSARIQSVPWSDGILNGYQASRALATIPELGLPSAWYIWGVLGFYIVAIGPVHYFVLRRVKKRELAWLTIPLLVIVFSGLAYGTGAMYRGVTPILNRLAVAQAWEGAEQAQVHGLVGLYSPVRRKYDLVAANGFVFQPFEGSENNLQSHNDWIISDGGAGMVMSDVQGEIAAMKSIAIEGSMPALEFDHDLVITLSKTNPVISGTVTNRSPYKLRDAYLVISNYSRKLGVLDPGETITVNNGMITNSYGRTLFSEDAMSILQLDYSDLDTEIDSARRYAFLDLLLRSNYGTFDGNADVFLLGWVDGIELPATLQDQKSRTIDTLLYVARLSPAIRVERGEIKLTTSIFTWEASVQTASPYYASDVPANGYILRFQPAVPVRFRTVKSMEIRLASNVALHELVVSAWDYDAKTWVRLQQNGNPIRVEDPQRYVGPDGEVRLQIKSNNSGWTEIQGSNISVVVVP